MISLIIEDILYVELLELMKLLNTEYDDYIGLSVNGPTTSRRVIVMELEV